MAWIVCVAGGHADRAAAVLATNLAGELARFGPSVLVDADMPARPAAAWYERRHGAGRAGRLEVATAYSQQELRDRVASLAQSAQYLVVSVPCHLGAGALETLRRAHLGLLPVGADGRLPEGAEALLGRMRDAPQDAARDLRVVGVGDPRAARPAQDPERGDALPVLPAALGADAAYAAAFEAGATAAEVAPGAARQEVIALVAAVRRIARAAPNAAA